MSTIEQIEPPKAGKLSGALPVACIVPRMDGTSSRGITLQNRPAVDLVMGHLPGDVAGAPYAIEMAARYRGRIADDRLAAVADRVRRWLVLSEAEGLGPCAAPAVASSGAGEGPVGD